MAHRAAPSSASQRVFAPGCFDDQVAVITGGGTGIGLATARELVQLGARVAICSRDAERIEAAAKEIGPLAVPIVADVSSAEGAEAFVAKDMIDFSRANLSAKYGKDWEATASQLSHRRLKSWGMNTMAAWSSGTTGGWSAPAAGAPGGASGGAGTDPPK